MWLENVSERFIRDLDFTTDIKTGGVTVDVKLSGMALAGEKIRVTASSGGQQVTGGNGDIFAGRKGVSADTALRFERYLGISAALLIRLQAEYLIGYSEEIVDRR